MYARTEDDLSERIRRLRPVEPRPALEGRVLAAMARSTGDRPANPQTVPAARSGLDRAAAASGLAAAASLAALFVGLVLTIPGDAPDDGGAAFRSLAAAPATAFATRSAPARGVAADGGGAADVDPLIEASWLLERAIGSLPAPRRIMRADTASTIVSLETRIAEIDAALGAGSGSRADGPEREALWRDRVDVMAALYQVRYAQSRTFEF